MDNKIKKRRLIFMISCILLGIVYSYVFKMNAIAPVMKYIKVESSVLKTIIVVLLAAFMGILNFTAIYFLTYNITGFWIPKKDYKDAKPKHKFLFLVFAHNEKDVIEASVTSMIQVNYPKDLFGVCVIADNCTDNTAEIVENFNDDKVKVLRRFNNELKGKQYAANWVIDNYSEEFIKEGYEYVVFLDADNHVDTEFLKEMNSDLIANPEAVVIQGYLGVKNPDSNYVSRGYAATYNVFNRFYQLGKRYLRVNSHIGGTGFIFDLHELSEMGWHTTSLTEDYEMMVKLTLKNKLVLWNHWAVTYDEKPTSMKASCVQRLRWCRGHWQVSLVNMKEIVKSFGKIHILNSIDMFSTAIVLGKSLVMVLSIVTGVTLAVVTQSISAFLLPGAVSMISFVILYIQSIVAQRVDFGRGFWSSILYSTKLIRDYLVYNISFIPLQIHGLFTYKNKIWIRTEHKMNTLNSKE